MEQPKDVEQPKDLEPAGDQQYWYVVCGMWIGNTGTKERSAILVCGMWISCCFCICTRVRSPPQGGYIGGYIYERILIVLVQLLEKILVVVYLVERILIIAVVAVTPF